MTRVRSRVAESDPGRLEWLIEYVCGEGLVCSVCNGYRHGMLFVCHCIRFFSRPDGILLVMRQFPPIEDTSGLHPSWFLVSVCGGRYESDARCL